MCSSYAGIVSFRVYALDYDYVVIMRVGPKGVIVLQWDAKIICSPYAMRRECCISVTGLKRGSWVVRLGKSHFFVGFPIVLYLLSETNFAIRAM